MLSRNVSLMGSYDNRFGAGGGLSEILKSIGIKFELDIQYRNNYFKLW
jgi:hypothetical protein